MQQRFEHMHTILGQMQHIHISWHGKVSPGCLSIEITLLATVDLRVLCNDVHKPELALKYQSKIILSKES